MTEIFLENQLVIHRNKYTQIYNLTKNILMGYINKDVTVILLLIATKREDRHLLTFSVDSLRGGD